MKQIISLTAISFFIMVFLCLVRERGKMKMNKWVTHISVGPLYRSRRRSNSRAAAAAATAYILHRPARGTILGYSHHPFFPLLFISEGYLFYGVSDWRDIEAEKLKSGYNL